MTGIRIEVLKLSDEFVVLYESKTDAQPLKLSGDNGLEIILARMPVESFRDAWRQEVVKTRDLMLSHLTNSEGDIIDVMFDISEGFYFQASHARNPEIVVRAKTALEALLRMPVTHDDDREMVSLEDDDATELLGLCSDLLAGSSQNDANELPDGPDYHKALRFKFVADITRNITPEISRAVRLSVLEALEVVDYDAKALRWPSRGEMEDLAKRYSEELLGRILAPSNAKTA